MLSARVLGLAMLLSWPIQGCGESHREPAPVVAGPAAEDAEPGAGTAGRAAGAQAAGAPGSGLRAGDPVSITMVSRPDAGSDPMPERSTGETPRERPAMLPDLSTCPELPPDAGTACPQEWQVCTYGDSQRADCRTVRRCSGGTWVDDSEACEPPPEGHCPDSPPQGSCSIVARAVCEYPGPILCDCGGDAGWRCFEPPPQPCPSSPPNLGTACPEQGLDCVYGDACRAWGTRVYCRDGAWYPLGVSCWDGPAP